MQIEYANMGLEIYKAGELNYSDYKKLTIEAKDDLKSIRADVYDELETDPNLGLVNSPSKVADWNLWVDIFAYIAYLLHGMWITYKQQLEEAALRAIPHNKYWYATKSKAFQYGDVLDGTTGGIIYPVIDLSKQIIKVASVKESQGGLIIKVAKEDNGNLVALDSSELTAFDGYINNIKDAGVFSSVVSQNADLLKLEADIYYNSIIPIADIRAATEQAIVNYLINFPFDGIFRRTALVDAIQAVQGVIDVKIKTCEISVNYTTTPNFNAVDVFYETIAGYINLDANYPLSTGLNFVANV